MFHFHFSIDTPVSRFMKVSGIIRLVRFRCSYEKVTAQAYYFTISLNQSKILISNKITCQLESMSNISS